MGGWGASFKITLTAACVWARLVSVSHASVVQDGQLGMCHVTKLVKSVQEMGWRKKMNELGSFFAG